MDLLSTQIRFETVQDYVAWTRTGADPHRTELDNGKVLDMAPETLGHIRAKTRMHAALARAIHAAGVNCEAVGDGIGVQVSARSLYKPDAVVYCGKRLPPASLIVDDPVIVVEVVSPTSGTRDLVEKMPAYMRVPSIMHYLLVHPTSHFIVHFRSAEENAPAVRIHYEGAIELNPPGIFLRVDEVLSQE